jgi:hypothetical protein
MKYIKLVIDIILVLLGVLFLLNSATDIQLGFGLIYLLFGISDLASLKMYWNKY